MLFNSLEYLVFYLLVLLVGWFLLAWPRVRIWTLLLASLYFYASNNHWQVLLLLITSSLDYWICLRLQVTEPETERKQLLALSLVSNLGLLAYFKYANFFASSMAALAESLGLHLDWVDLNIILPVGISFFTFEALSYTIDVYRHKIAVEPQWHRLVFMVAFFPHLIAGPIVRAADFLPQLRRTPVFTPTVVEESLYRIFTGLFKKIVLADFLAQYVDLAFDHTAQVDSLGAWIGVYAFAFQIYFDFSGYTDIAIGSAKLLGFQLPENFRQPYVAWNFSDFWRRWHMSLSLWLRDYLYVALGGNRVLRRWHIYRNLLLTMLLGGLWHGAQWHFVIWGGVHGMILSLERFLGWHRQCDIPTMPAVRFWRGLLMFHLIAFSWVPFRVNDLRSLGHLLKLLCGSQPPSVVTVGMALVVTMVAAGWLVQWLLLCWPDWQEKMQAWPISLKAAIYAAIWATVVIFNADAPQPFIYFRF
ncbi:MAG: MBOAT family protein [Magnetococcales bacterium]|nr:MBOAT family protein [Magnetococcales bacterium]